MTNIYHFEFFLGRKKEIDEMRELLHAIKCDDSRIRGNRRVVLIEGEGGIGKTRVLEALMDTAEDEDFK